MVANAQTPHENRSVRHIGDLARESGTARPTGTRLNESTMNAGLNARRAGVSEVQVTRPRIVKNGQFWATGRLNGVSRNMAITNQDVIGGVLPGRPCGQKFRARGKAVRVHVADLAGRPLRGDIDWASRLRRRPQKRTKAAILSRLRVDLLDAVLRNVYKFGDIDSAIGSRGVTLAIPAFLALPNMRE